LKRGGRNRLRYFVQNVSGISSIVVALAAAALNILGLLTDSQLLPAVLTAVALLAITEVTASVEISEERTEVQSVFSIVDRLERLYSKSNVVLAKYPETFEQYYDLWGGFEDNYYVYNPAYRVEQRPGLSSEELIERVYVARYRNRKFDKAHYLFLTGDGDGETDFATFCKMVNDIRKTCPEIVSKLEVKKISTEKAAASGEFYLGMRNGIKTSVIEPIEKGLTRGRGTPSHYLATSQEAIYDRLKEFFDEEWGKAGPSVVMF
jgi:hypothetical protein